MLHYLFPSRREHALWLAMIFPARLAKTTGPIHSPLHPKSLHLSNTQILARLIWGAKPQTRPLLLPLFEHVTPRRKGSLLHHTLVAAGWKLQIKDLPIECFSLRPLDIKIQTVAGSYCFLPIFCDHFQSPR